MSNETLITITTINTVNELKMNKTFYNTIITTFYNTKTQFNENKYS